MPSMMVLAVTAVPEHVRGALSRWLIEPAPGLYVGCVSARVRDELWTAVSAVIGDGSAVCIHPADTEQGYEVRSSGSQRREPIDFDGLTLIRFQALDQPSDTPDADFL
ncbi:type I-E CRISPR-associated endoribonuclease Cas2e [Thermasporomyces composti]|jgi:CRISPR-associated protein Cas2|uniref:CRISPR-associated Cas2 family protein n=1 Tax=Thermasporomyces composti TaxID=696763 RepID=A0A3D9V444_THECX|nr:type I-E CRISPR-associated endoribonuclease Cas2e [Thermasporomyces composti]REF36287.1 CRISPR-associated Cas2 family protein [Thermasporomyces composti]